MLTLAQDRPPAAAPRRLVLGGACLAAFFAAFLLGGLDGVRPAAAQYRGPTRVNFDERLIKGQTTKSGSVYIFDRQQSEVRSLIDRKRSFRDKILRTVFEE